MEVLGSQCDPQSLIRLCELALRSLVDGEFDVLTSTYSYAVALNRELAQAAREDLASSMSESDSLLGVNHLQVRVKHFTPNDVALHAVVECFLATRLGAEVLVEFVLSGSERMFLTLEQISPVVSNET